MYLVIDAMVFHPTWQFVAGAVLLYSNAVAKPSALLFCVVDQSILRCRRETPTTRKIQEALF